jgi:hypothetical protein
VRRAVAAAGRDPDAVPVLVDLAFGGATGPVPAARVIETAVRLRAADGVVLVPVDAAAVRAVTAELVPLLAGRGLFRPGRLVLGRPARREESA